VPRICRNLSYLDFDTDAWHGDKKKRIALAFSMIIHSLCAAVVMIPVCLMRMMIDDAFEAWSLKQVGESRVSQSWDCQRQTRLQDAVHRDWLPDSTHSLTHSLTPHSFTRSSSFFNLARRVLRPYINPKLRPTLYICVTQFVHVRTTLFVRVTQSMQEAKDPKDHAKMSILQYLRAHNQRATSKTITSLVNSD
jgi:hypothetical protein